MIDDPFEILGVSPTASLSEARATFRRLAQMYHPDRYVDAPASVREEAERRMRDLNEAFASLVARRRDGAEPADLLREDPWLAGWWNSWERRRIEDETRAARYRRWDDIERQRIERESRERSAVELMWRKTYGGGSDAPVPAQLPESTRAKSLHERLQEAKRLQEQEQTLRLDPVELDRAVHLDEPAPVTSKAKGATSGKITRSNGKAGAAGKAAAAAQPASNGKAAKKVAYKRSTGRG